MTMCLDTSTQPAVQLRSSVAAVALLLLSVNSSAQPVAPHAVSDRAETLARTVPRVASFSTAAFTLENVALAAAPFLWPTHSELFHPQGVPIRVPGSSPPAFRDDPASTGRHYYYAIREVSVASAAQKVQVDLSDWTRRLPDGVTGIKVRYFFYFQRETGAGAHVNDLESAEFYLLVEPGAGGAVDVYLWKAFGAAHGLAWSTNSSNLLRASTVVSSRGEGTAFECRTDDCRYRPVLFVEEGKHATALDLNRDGHLTPLVDLNKSFREAWGIRDALGYNSRVPPGFAAEYFVPRVPSAIWAPEGEAGYPRTLRVMPARDTPVCGGDPTYLNDLHAFQRRQGSTVLALSALACGKDFCAGPSVNQSIKTPRNGFWSEVGDGFRWGSPETPYGEPALWNTLHVAYRYDRGSEIALVVPVAVSFPFIGGWVAPKINAPTDELKAASFELMAVTSSTRKFGWYVSAGGRLRSEDAVRATFLEAGVKIRTVPKGGLMPSFRLGYRARLGSRGRADDQRLVFEAGVGVW